MTCLYSPRIREGVSSRKLSLLDLCVLEYSLAQEMLPVALLPKLILRVFEPVKYLCLDLVSYLSERLQQLLLGDVLAAWIVEDPDEPHPDTRERLRAVLLGTGANDDRAVEADLPHMGLQALRVLVVHVYADLIHGLDRVRVHLVTRRVACTVRLEAVPG